MNESKQTLILNTSPYFCMLNCQGAQKRTIYIFQLTLLQFRGNSMLDLRRSQRTVCEGESAGMEEVKQCSKDALYKGVIT